VWAATAWDDADWEGVQARGWTVMGRLRARQESLRNHAIQACRRVEERERKQDDPVPAATAGAQRDAVRAEWHGGPTVVALLFAHPDSEAVRTLDARGEYFNCRTGETWDLFFPGYYKSANADLEVQTGATRVGPGFASDWFFSAGDFNLFRADIQRLSEGRWTYSGGTDLVVINGWIPDVGEPVIDWPSTMAGALSDEATKTLTIAQVVERLTRDLETQAEDPAYGVGEVTCLPVAPGNSMARQIVIGALGGIGAALGKKGLGM
jgi:hypothetical protein